MTALENAIITLVNDRNALKVTELVALLPKRIHKDNTSDQLFSAVDHLVDTKQLVRIDYVVPYLDYRVQSILLPGGTKMDITNWTQLTNTVKDK